MNNDVKFALITTIYVIFQILIMVYILDNVEKSKHNIKAEKLTVETAKNRVIFVGKIEKDTLRIYSNSEIIIQ